MNSSTLFFNPLRRKHHVNMIMQTSNYIYDGHPMLLLSEIQKFLVFQNDDKKYSIWVVRARTCITKPNLFELSLVMTVISLTPESCLTNTTGRELKIKKDVLTGSYWL